MWLKLLEDNYEVRCGMYNKYMKEMLKQIPTTITKVLSPKQKFQKLMTEIGGGWYMEKIAKRFYLQKAIHFSKSQTISVTFLYTYEVNFGKKPVPGFSLIFKRFTRYCMVQSKIVHE